MEKEWAPKTRTGPYFRTPLIDPRWPSAARADASKRRAAHLHVVPTPWRQPGASSRRELAENDRSLTAMSRATVNLCLRGTRGWLCSSRTRFVTKRTIPKKPHGCSTTGSSDRPRRSPAQSRRVLGARRPAKGLEASLASPALDHPASPAPEERGPTSVRPESASADRIESRYPTDNTSHRGRAGALRRGWAALGHLRAGTYDG